MSFSSQNLLSFNVSKKDKKTDLKLNAISKSKSDVIFICDIRLNSTRQTYAIHDIEKKIKFKGYDLFFNSKGSNRGVGILISSKLDYEIHNKLTDFDDNYILLDITIAKKRCIIGSIYGPNTNNSDFYEDLSTDLNMFDPMYPVIIGGDWNATYDNSDAQYNPDVINMVNIPSRLRSNKLLNLCNNHNLCDAYRTLHPLKTEFSYVPNIQMNNNRSRLDFFLVSKNLIKFINSCSIDHSTLNTFFDHKLSLIHI